MNGNGWAIHQPIIHQHWSNCQSPFRSVQRRQRRATNADLGLDLGVDNSNIIIIIIMSIIWLTPTLTLTPTLRLAIETKEGRRRRRVVRLTTATRNVLTSLSLRYSLSHSLSLRWVWQSNHSS